MSENTTNSNQHLVISLKRGKCTAMFFNVKTKYISTYFKV